MSLISNSANSNQPKGKKGAFKNGPPGDIFVTFGINANFKYTP
jgi:hypothetical protein